MRRTTRQSRRADLKPNTLGSYLRPPEPQPWSFERCLSSPAKQVIMRMWWRRRNKHPSPEALRALEHSRRALEETQERSHEAEALGAWLRRVRAANHMSERVEALIQSSYGEDGHHGSDNVR